MKQLMLLSAVAHLAACSDPIPEVSEENTSAAAEGRLVVYVVNHPLEYFAERIGGDAVRVEFPAPEGDPAYWSPDPETVIDYQAADLILLNGAGYAKWTERASLPPSRTVDTSAAFADRLIAVGSVTHAHGPEGHHEHGAMAFTTWLDLSLAIDQARAVLRAFRRARPGEAEGFRRRFAELERDLRAVDESLTAAVVSDPNRPMLASHPVYQYLEFRYGLNLVSVHWEPGEEPDELQWREVQRTLEDHPAHWMLWEAKPLEETRARLEALGVMCLVIDPGGSRRSGGDFLDVMRANADSLARAFR